MKDEMYLHPSLGQAVSKHLYNSYLLLLMFTPFTVKGCSLELLTPGEQGIITFCNIPHKQIRKQLLETGIYIGNKITVIQKKPLFKIKVNDITMTIDMETARAIYVRIIDT